MSHCGPGKEQGLCLRLHRTFVQACTSLKVSATPQLDIHPDPDPNSRLLAVFHHRRLPLSNTFPFPLPFVFPRVPTHCFFDGGYPSATQ